MKAIFLFGMNFAYERNEIYQKIPECSQKMYSSFNCSIRVPVTFKYDSFSSSPRLAKEVSLKQFIIITMIDISVSHGSAAGALSLARTLDRWGRRSGGDRWWWYFLIAFYTISKRSKLWMPTESLRTRSFLFARVDNRSSYLDINSINSFLIASASNLLEPIWNAGELSFLLLVFRTASLLFSLISRCLCWPSKSNSLGFLHLQLRKWIYL